MAENLWVFAGRKAHSIIMEQGFVDKLPYRKIPGRNDFKLFRRSNKERISYWNRVAKESSRLGDEFLEITHRRSIQEKLRLLQYRRCGPGFLDNGVDS